jgi:hypothetical protein
MMVPFKSFEYSGVMLQHEQPDGGVVCEFGFQAGWLKIRKKVFN